MIYYTSNTFNHDAHTDQVISRQIIIRSSLKRKANYDFHIYFQVNSLNWTHTDMDLFRRSIYMI